MARGRTYRSDPLINGLDISQHPSADYKDIEKSSLYIFRRSSQRQYRMPVYHVGSDPTYFTPSTIHYPSKQRNPN